MFKLNAFSTRVKKSLLYDNISKSKADYYNTHNIFVNKKSMTLLLCSVISKEIDFDIDKVLSIKQIVVGCEFGECSFTKEEINFKKDIKDYKDYKVLFFRQAVDPNMVLSQLHFYNGKLIYANTAFTYLGEDEKFRKLILLELSHKYNIEINNELESDIIVKDQNNNRLMIIDNGRIVLHYVSGDDDLLNCFKKESGLDINTNQQKQEQLSLISSII